MRLLVTLGTDGNTDWVRTPDGQKFNLGSVSALTFVTRLALGGARDARKALDGFLQGKEVVLRVDDDKMWDLLAPHRSRWAADSFIPYDHRKRGNGTMTISKDLEVLENHVQGLHKAAEAKVSPEKMAEGRSILARLAQRLADQSSNSNYMSSGEPDVVTVEEVDQVKLAADSIIHAAILKQWQEGVRGAEQVIAKNDPIQNEMELNAALDGMQVDAGSLKSDVRVVEHYADSYNITHGKRLYQDLAKNLSGVVYWMGFVSRMAGQPGTEDFTVKVASRRTPKLAHDAYKANSEAATQILDKVDAVNARIDELVTAGKKFDSKRAKSDIHSVASKVASIVNDVDLTTPWVAGDLAKLAARAEHLHKLFFPAK